MLTKLTIKNYRCFVSPATIEVGKGFTAFVGVNNAGKSTAMRFLLEFRDLFQKMTESRGELFSAITALQSLNLAHVVDPEEVFSNLNNDGLEIEITFSYGAQPSATLPSSVVISVSRDLHWRAKITAGTGVFNGKLPPNVVHQKSQLRVGEGSYVLDLRPIHDVAKSLANTLYIGPFRNTINVGSHTGYLDMQIGEAFIQHYRELKTGRLKKQSAAMVGLVEDIRRIFEFDSLNIEPTDDNKSLHITVNGKPYKQHELGSGLLQFIMVLANASVRNPTYILIDEPELSLHPRLQLDFLTTLAAYASEGIWFTTHSMGLARSAADRIYSVQREGEGDSAIRPLEATPRLAELLGELNFSSRRDLGLQGVLLVEGATDVKTLQQVLRKLGKDHKVILLQLAGRINGEMASELEEVLRISRDVAAIIDSEKGGSDAPLDQKRAAFVKLCSTMGIKCHVLERRATENYLCDRAVKASFGESYRALQPFEPFKAMSPRWDKTQNWRVAEIMTLEEWDNTDVGGFLRDL